ncbi:MAG: hypothetical protein M1832_006033 [Thelocarpon impressellum]|nr:MAG: hypothetical protein M1832_006033 [Thelocarpon impressellum]
MFILSAVDGQENQDELVASDADLMSALDCAVEDAEREDWLDRVLWEHRDMFPAVDVALTSRINSDKAKELGLRQKLVMALEADLPMADPAPMFKIYLVTIDTSGDAAQYTGMWLSWKTSFARFLGVLRDGTAPSARLAGHDGGYTLRDGPWTYQVITEQNKTATSKVVLADEHGYRSMLRQLRCKGTPVAAVMHEMTRKMVSPIDVGQTDLTRPTHPAQPEPLNEDGTLYFEPVNWEKFAEIGIGGDGLFARPIVKDLPA